MTDWRDLALLVLALLGFGISALFVRAMSGREPPTWVPQLCRLDTGVCATILDSPYARLMGPSNAALGMAWYGILGCLAAAAAATGSLIGWPFILAPAVLAVIVSAVLAWALIVKLRVPCPLCFTGHAINAFVLPLLAWRGLLP